MSVDALVKSISIENMINQRARVGELLAQAHAILQEANGLAIAAHLGSIEDALYPHYHGDRINFAQAGAAEKVAHVIDGPAWSYLMEESGLRTFMDATARAEWDAKIKKGEFPPMSYETIRDTFGNLYAMRGDMFTRGVVALFEKLSWDYKTNQPFKFGKRIILNGFCGSCIYGSGMDRLDDLERVHCVLDGKPEPDSRDGVGQAIRYKHHRERADSWDGTYFSVRWFKKGSAHVTFKRPDLVTQMNRILATKYPHALAVNN